MIYDESSLYTDSALLSPYLSTQPSTYSTPGGSPVLDLYQSLLGRGRVPSFIKLEPQLIPAINTIRAALGKLSIIVPKG